MIKRYTLLSISLFLTTLFMAGCSLSSQKAPEQTQPANEPPKKLEPLDSAQNVVDKNTKIATEISEIETKIALLEKEISQMSPGADRAKLVKNKSQLEQKVDTLRNRQVDNAKEFKTSKQQEAVKKADTSSKVL